MNGRVWVGVDPGRRGAMAMIRDAWPSESRAEIVAWPTPMLDAKRYDLQAIATWFADWKPSIALVTVEMLHPMPPKFRGGAANFGRGESRGWFWMLTALGIPFLPVVPQTWQRVMHVGAKGDDTKARSIETALRIFPGVSLLESGRARKHHDGMADALCIAQYGRQTQRGAGK